MNLYPEEDPDNPLNHVSLNPEARVVNRHIRWDWLSFMEDSSVPAAQSVKALCGKTTSVRYAGIPGVTEQPIVFYIKGETRWGWCLKCCLLMLKKCEEIESDTISVGKYYHRQIRIAENIGRTVLGLKPKTGKHISGPQPSKQHDHWARKEPCYLCWETIPQNGALDHIIPASLGGSDDWWNRAYVCEPCNGKKYMLLPHELGAKFPNVLLPRRFVKSIT